MGIDGDTAIKMNVKVKKRKFELGLVKLEVPVKILPIQFSFLASLYIYEVTCELNRHIYMKASLICVGWYN